jgi:UDP-N-acetylmuramoyl-L-alanyl-D-glutamate--2,6-diaminopimelate ligase
MKLTDITADIAGVKVVGDTDIEIAGITHDSRQVRPGYIFAALRGTHTDGGVFFDDAITRGAVAVLTASDSCETSEGIVCIFCDDARRGMAEIAARVYGHPSSHLTTFGITGTNGKTTVSFLIRDILAAAGRQAGLIGTVQYEIGGRMLPAGRTTPESTDIQRMLSEMLRAGCDSAVMEVSSHGLVQDRAASISFDAAIFTNLTRDHLDYHETMESYFEAKSILFNDMLKSGQGHSVINIDDHYGRRLVAETLPIDRTVTFGLSPLAQVRAENLTTSGLGSEFTLCTPWGSSQVRISLIGDFNVSNALAAAAAAGSIGVELSTIAAALKGCVGVPGRLEEISTGRSFRLFVDYAHTDDALDNVLSTLRGICERRLIVVFGCGGNRDKSKREAMGAVASQYADVSILTSDNPRQEDPGQILNQITQGMAAESEYEVVEDRASAIARAIDLAGKRDIVLIAGKGHESFQELGNTKIPFDDRTAARRALGLV